MGAKKTIVFDLDDTLVKEMDYLRSAFRAIATHADKANDALFDEMLRWYRSKEDVFGNLILRYGHLQKDELKHMYRQHIPSFDPLSENRQILLDIKKSGHTLGLVSDGFSVTQRNKIRALGIEHIFDLIVISEEFGSEKPNEANFKIFHQFGNAECYYISDNVNKDFIGPKRLGWTTVCLLDDGQNIHAQDFDKPEAYLPDYRITHLSELAAMLNIDIIEPK